MHAEIAEKIAILERTPATLATLLDGLSDGWIRSTEGGETWSAYDIVGHLIHGERTDWMPRARIILADGEARTFEPYDRFAQFRESAGKSLGQLLREFTTLRGENMAALAELDLGPEDLAKRGRHPELGTVTLGELLSTWVVHDLGHVAQISRAMSARFAEAVGPWVVYLPVLRRR